MTRSQQKINDIPSVYARSEKGRKKQTLRRRRLTMEEEHDRADNDAVLSQSMARDEPRDEDIPVVVELTMTTRQKTGYLAFIKVFFTSHGAPQILLLSVLLAFAVGSTIGIVSYSQAQAHKLFSYHYLFSSIKAFVLCVFGCRFPTC